MYKSRKEQYTTLKTTVDLGKFIEEIGGDFIPCGPFCVLIAPTLHFNAEQVRLEQGAYIIVVLLTTEGKTVVMPAHFIQNSNDLNKVLKKILTESPKDMFLGDWMLSKEEIWQLVGGHIVAEQYFTFDDLYPYCDEVIDSILKSEFPYKAGLGDFDAIDGGHTGIAFTQEDVLAAIENRSDLVYSLPLLDDMSLQRAPEDICFVSFDYQKGFSVQTGPYKDTLLSFMDAESGYKPIPRSFVDHTKKHNRIRPFVGPERNGIYAVKINDIGSLLKQPEQGEQPIRSCVSLLEVGGLLAGTLPELFSYNRRFGTL